MSDNYFLGLIVWSAIVGIVGVLLDLSLAGSIVFGAVMGYVYFVLFHPWDKV